MSKSLWVVLILLVLLLRAAPLRAAEQGGQRPNVVILLADDLGYGDLSCKGGPVSTPHIDRLFSQGTELETFLVMPVCSPTRAAFLTGRHPARVGVNPTVINARSGESMNPRETLLPELLKSAGYATGLVGKWHLGYAPSSPNLKGFDFFYGFMGAATSYLTRPDDPHTQLMLNDKPSPDPGYSTDLFRDRAVQYVGEHKEHPFFLYVAFNAVHNPVEATEPYIARVPASISDAHARARAGMLIALDDAVGAIVKKIDDEGLAQRTIVLFFADNGPTPDGRAAPFRGAKHTVYDGGVRSPTVVRWTGRLQPAARTGAMLAAEDLFPTLLKLTGTPVPENLALDGKDFSACLTSADAPSLRDAQYWLWRDCDAIRTATHKLVRYADRVELYDLRHDPGEKKDLSKEQPDVAADLQRRLDAWEASVPVYPTHVPLKIAGLKPEPSGDVIEVRAKRGEATRQNQMLGIPLGRCERFQLNSGDRLEFDVLLAPGSASDGIRVDFVNPERGKKLGRGRAVTEDDEPGASAAGIQDKRTQPTNGRWVRRTIGMANQAPRMLETVWLVFDGRQAADYHLYLDNVVVRRADGSTIELYRDGKPLERRAGDTSGYSDVTVQSVRAETARASTP